ncbi:50S ribosomal protein L36 [Candidatus Peribacteria bacterium]|nr:50S ribosomal protein L36 [Candidatus Peribacteria bacterium]
MKVRASVKPVCKHCYIVRRGGRVFNFCSDPRNAGRHKQAQKRGVRLTPKFQTYRTTA